MRVGEAFQVLHRTRERAARDRDRATMNSVSHASSAVEAEPTPAPPPASEERRTSHPHVGAETDRIERFARCRSIDELPPDLQDNPFVQYVMSMTPEEEAREIAAAEAHREAYALYEDDP